MNKIKAIITTSANPFHYGHLDLYNKAKAIFKDVEVIVAQNSEKSTNSNIEFHLNAYKIPFTIIKDKTVADYCKENGIKHIVRGIRNGVDAEYELKLDFANREINPDVQTVFIPTSDVYSNISSSTIRELLKYKKFDIVKKYMDEVAMLRWISGCKYKVYFGKSCVGKSTFLKNKNISSINVDTYFWKVAEKVFGIEKANGFKEISKNIFYSSLTIQEKIEKLHNKEFFTDEFWKVFFDNLISTSLDWASVGFYYKLIPVKYLSQMKFIELTCSDEDRKERIKSKGFENNIKMLDELYFDPEIIDETFII